MHDNACQFTHIVAHVVRDGGGVVGIILIQASHNLAAEVRTHIRGLGVDAAAHTAEHGHSAAAQAVACRAVEENLPVVCLRVDGAVEGQQQPKDKHTQRAQGVAHDTSTPEGGVEALSVALLCTGQGGTCVGVGGNHHPKETAQHGSEGTCQEGTCCQGSLSGAVRAPRHQEVDHQGERQAEKAANCILHLQKLDGTIHDLRINLWHQFFRDFARQ